MIGLGHEACHYNLAGRSGESSGSVPSFSGRAGYEDAPPATTIHRLKIGAEQEGFGRDVIGLIRAKNDFKHDRGPTNPEEVANASEETQEKLRRCMEVLDPLADHPIREKDGVVGHFFLEAGDARFPLYPFITSARCPQCGNVETYFVDAWDTRKGTARLKSFEKGHTIDAPEVSDALARWI